LKNKVALPAYILVYTELTTIMYKGIKGLVVYCSLVAVIRMETKYESPVSFRITPKKTPSNKLVIFT